MTANALKAKSRKTLIMVLKGRVMTVTPMEIMVDGHIVRDKLGYKILVMDL